MEQETKKPKFNPTSAEIQQYVARYIKGGGRITTITKDELSFLNVNVFGPSQRANYDNCWGGPSPKSFK